MAKQLTFTELDSLLSKVNEKGSVITNNTFSKIDEWIDTGNYLLNAQLSGTLFGGYPNSRSICLAGESGTGKTFLTLNACREAQKMGYNIIYMDSEAAVDEDIVRNFGINPDTFRYQPVSTPQEVRHFVTNLCDTIKKAKGSEIPKIMLVLDSLGNLATNKERTDAISGSEKKDMTKQQELRSLFRVITTDLAEIKIPFIFTNHTYACALGDTPVLLANGKYKKLEQIKIGDIVLTIEGEKPVTNTFKYENTRTIKLHFENDVVIECSPLHKFLVGNDPKNPESWVTAEDLLEGNFVMQLNDISSNLKQLKLLKKEQGNLNTVYDIEVADAHHYMSSDGIIMHNSIGSYIPSQTISGGGGAIYNASVILQLSKSSLKEGDDEASAAGVQKTGIIVTSKAAKNRFARPIPIKFHISFNRSLPPFFNRMSK